MAEGRTGKLQKRENKNDEDAKIPSPGNVKKRNRASNSKIPIAPRSPSKRAAKEKAKEILKQITIDQANDDIVAKQEDAYKKKVDGQHNVEAKEGSSKKTPKKRTRKNKFVRFFEMLDKLTTPEAERVLADTKESDLIATYEECKPGLDKLWEEYILNPPDFISLQDSLWAINTTTEDSHLAMLNHLYDMYEAPLGYELPRHTDFLLQILMPEWITAIIMKRFDQTRAEVLNIHKTPYRN